MCPVHTPSLGQSNRVHTSYFSNKTFSFGYLMVNKNLAWFRTLLEHTLPVDNENPSSSQSTFAATMFKRLKASVGLSE